MTGGLLLALAGVWLGAQVIGGDLTGRIGLTSPSTGAAPAPQGTTGTGSTFVTPDQGLQIASSTGLGGAIAGLHAQPTGPVVTEGNATKSV